MNKLPADGQGGTDTASVTVTVSANGVDDNNTVLVAHFVNGNNAALDSRVYLWNPSPSAGNVTVRVFTLPLTGGLAQELTRWGDEPDLSMRKGMPIGSLT